jgi:hypothetical protein
LNLHGISAISGWVCFATEAAGFSRLFPGEQQPSVRQQQQQVDVAWHQHQLTAGCASQQEQQAHPGEQQQQRVEL